MKILLVNDDGYGSKGIETLKELLKPYGEIYVVAPEHAMSGKSVAITIYTPMVVHKRGHNEYSLEGTPADCVSFGLTHLGVDFDLVVSGINYGHNISYDVMHSGTCGACIEALLFDKPAIAFSSEGHFESAKKAFDDVMKYIKEHELSGSTEYFLNVNFPFGEEIKGIELASLSIRNDHRYFEDFEDGTIKLARDIGPHEELDKKGDVYLVNNGYVSITPLMKSYFSNDLYKKIKKEKKL
jgi:5'-nucleotidase